MNDTLATRLPQRFRVPRPRRPTPGGYVYHVWNRGSRRGPLFESSGDYEQFEQLMDEARRKRPMRIISYQLMPTHFHFLLWPEEDGDLSRFMKWLTGTHARRWHWQRDSVGAGAVYQSRYSSKIISDGRHLFTAWRYVERNALAANLVDRAEDWRWSSAWQAIAASPTFVVDEGPYPRLTNWLDFLNDP